MSGLTTKLPGFGPGYDGQVSQADLDQYDLIAIDNPSTSSSWFGAGTVTNAPGAIVQANQVADWPRNCLYQVTGGTVGGTFTANLVDQFGLKQTETVVVGTAAAGGSVFGTVIAAKFMSGTFSPITANTGTATIGFGTVTNAGTGQSNWFGLLTKLGGTSDIKIITWVNNTTPTTLNKGTALGTLVDTTRHAFQGTSGVAATDHYKVIMKPTFDNSAQGTMSGL